MYEHLYKHSRSKTNAHIEASLTGQRSGCKAAQNYKGQENWHFGEDGLQKRTDKCSLDTALISTGEFQNS